MTDTKQLAADIKRVMELDAKRTQGDWPMWAGLTFYDQKIPEGATLAQWLAGDGTCWPVGDLGNREKGHPEKLSQVVALVNGQDNQSFIASAPRMADIIHKLTDIVRVQHEALFALTDSVEDRTIQEAREKAIKAIALAAPIVEEK